MSREPSPGLRHNRNWHRLWLAQAVSLTGDSVFDITVLLWVTTVIAKGRSWAPAAASGVLIAEAAPVLLVGPLAGVWVDRWDRRRTMMAADACRAVLIASLLIVPALGHRSGIAIQLAAVYGVVAAESSCAQFFNPSRLALLGVIVNPADRAQASGRLQATASTASIIGPPLAAPLLLALGPQWALIADAASFAISFAAIRSVRPPAAGPEVRHRPGFLAEFRAGVRFFKGSRVLVALSLGVVIATLGTGALNTLQVFFLTDDLHTAASWLGILFAAAGAGAVAGALLGGWAAARIGAARVFRLGMLLGGLLLLVYSRITWFPGAVVTVTMVGLMFGALNAAGPPLLLAAIPQHLIGRVMSVFNPLQQTANIVSMAAAGFLAGTLLRQVHVQVAGVTFGPVDTAFAICALFIITAGLVLTAQLRDSGPRAGEDAGPARRDAPGLPSRPDGKPADRPARRPADHVAK